MVGYAFLRYNLIILPRRYFENVELSFQEGALSFCCNSYMVYLRELTFGKFRINFEICTIKRASTQINLYSLIPYEIYGCL